eukprot:4985062-Amphidinium_carterae.4
MDNDNLNDVEIEITLPTLMTATTLSYVTHIDGDTEDDITRIREMQEVEDDMQSQLDEDRRREEERARPKELCHRRAQQTYSEYMDEVTRAKDANTRLERR